MPGFRLAYEAAQHEPWAPHYIRYKKLRNALRAARAASPPLPPALAAARLAKFARRLDRQIEALDLFALSAAGCAAAGAAAAAAELARIAGPATDARLRRLPPATLGEVRAVHAECCRICEELDALVTFLNWNTRAVKKLLKQAARTYGHAGLEYAASRQLPAARTALAAATVGGSDAATERRLPATPATSLDTAGRTPSSTLVSRMSLSMDVLTSYLQLEEEDAAVVPSESGPIGDNGDMVALRKAGSDRIALAAARAHLMSLADHFHSRPVAGIILTLARVLDRLAVAEESILERHAPARVGGSDAVAGDTVAAGAVATGVTTGVALVAEARDSNDGGDGFELEEDEDDANEITGVGADPDADANADEEAGNDTAAICSSLDVEADGEEVTWNYEADEPLLYEPVLRARGDEMLARLLAAKRRMDSRATLLQTTFAAQAGIPMREDKGEGETDEDSLWRESIPEFNMLLNACSALLYLVSMYAVLPTAGLYAESLGSSKAASGVLIGGAPLAGIFSAIMFSSMSSAGFKRPLVLATSICLVGNLMYSLAASFHSLRLAIIGRLVIGWGGARAINRRYIADCAPLPQLVLRSAQFVTASALGMALGPAMGSVVNRLPPTSLFGLYFDKRTNAAWTLVILWGGFLVALLTRFEEPRRRAQVSLPQLSQEPSATALSLHPPSNSEEVQMPLLAAEEGRLGREDYGTATLVDVDERRRRGFASRGQQPSPLRDLLGAEVVLFGLFVYFVIKFVCELMVSSSALVLPYYFGWTDGSVGVFIAFLGLLMFPANVMVAHVSLRLDEHQQLVGSLGLVLLGCILAVPILSGMLPLAQYVFACVSLFVSTNVAEAVLMAILARTMPSSLARGTWNAGLLTTECGMFGRFAGDMASTLCASGPDGIRWLLWRAFVPCAGLAAGCLCGAFYFEGQLAIDGGADESSSDGGNDGIVESDDKASLPDLDDPDHVDASEMR